MLTRHQDSADRFLAATAKVLGLTLVTADKRLLGLGSIRTMANR
jgi:PIN domain nuclease of toxin-antitoxin system